MGWLHTSSPTSPMTGSPCSFQASTAQPSSRHCISPGTCGSSRLPPINAPAKSVPPEMLHHQISPPRSRTSCRSLPPEGANFPWGGPAENCSPSPATSCAALSCSVIPAEAGIQDCVDSRFRGNDGEIGGNDELGAGCDDAKGWACMFRNWRVPQFWASELKGEPVVPRARTWRSSPQVLRSSPAFWQLAKKAAPAPKKVAPTSAPKRHSVPQSGASLLPASSTVRPAGLPS